MSSFYDITVSNNTISETAFNDPRIQETGEKRWANLEPEAKKEILESIAAAVTMVFFAIILTGIVVGICVAIAFGAVPLVALLPIVATMAATAWGIAGSFIKDAIKTVQEHLPPNPNLNEEGVEVVA